MNMPVCDVNVGEVIKDLIREECCDKEVHFDSIERKVDYYKRSVTFVVHLIVKEDVAKANYFRVLLQRIAQVILHYCGDYEHSVKIEFGVKVDKAPELIKMNITTAEENYIKEDVNKLMEVSKVMRDFVVPNVVEIIHRKSNRGEFFTVVWADDTKTTVKLMEGDTSDEYTAFMFALGKKIFGDKGNARKFVREKKQNFEDRMAKKSHEKAMQKKQAQFNQLMNSLEEDDFDDIEDEIYGQMFVAPAMISKKLFKRNK